jgi:hypothetical protein
MNTTNRYLEEAGRMIRQAEMMRACWEEMLEQVHVVSEQLREQVQQTVGADPSIGSDASSLRQPCQGSAM